MLPNMSGLRKHSLVSSTFSPHARKLLRCRLKAVHKMWQVKSMVSICEIQIGLSFSPKWTLCFKVALASWHHIEDIDIAFNSVTRHLYIQGSETCYEPGQLDSTCEVGIWSVQQVAKLSCSAKHSIHPSSEYWRWGFASNKCPGLRAFKQANGFRHVESKTQKLSPSAISVTFLQALAASTWNPPCWSLVWHVGFFSKTASDSLAPQRTARAWNMQNYKEETLAGLSL